MFPESADLLLTELWERALAERVFLSEEHVMGIYQALYLPLLMTCCFVTVGYWLPRLFGGDIDLGPPNART